ncbi:type VI secretion system-associated FHA domain protein TagH [Jannaschia seohaensis]|uniref:Type VI secretion system protein ImpI/type VI secretion system protein n=1 Tax=Jannaschia seohaensis TaxID=475081 RepID=A0A2Y9C8E3_9RHOB|nr:type VI secretion system-associated FHA domain protein TagH [Jannaschia seohaensis]PWJ16556.1 type VI secretion system protein ImpI/type VI secretion system protein [Jannaschia seohaensis]SSA48793.1 type VI secretion system protein ImpI/type VI secretion system protein [Jannaschia seohaensis]
MSIRLVLENAPHPQAVSERLFDEGRFVIGRSDDADWQIDDPEMFVSRRHCILTMEDGVVMAADASSGGLYIDNAAHPVGSGNQVPVEPGMRLRLGDFVIRIEAAREAPAAPPSAPVRGGMSFDFDFGPSEPAPEPPKRPESLPDPFGLMSPKREDPAAPPERRVPRPLDQDDPFALDLNIPRSEPSPPPPPSDGHDWFKGVSASPPSPPAPPPPSSVPEPPTAAPPEAPRDPFGDWSSPPPPVPPSDPQAGRSSDVPPPPEPAIAPRPPHTPPPPSFDVPSHATYTPKPDPAPRPEPEPEPAPRAAPPEPAPPPEPGPPPQRPAPATGASPDETAVFHALLQGMGLDPADYADIDPVEAAAQIGAATRKMTEGVMLLLRARSMNKQKARVAQTIIASADVNPLKFMATPEDALSIMLQRRSRGYLDADAALGEAFRDLTDHQVRTWTAVQVALRKMIDKFEPSAIEAEMTEIGLLGQLMAGGKNAKLWQLYEARYRKIAEAAEKDFLGEVGADFRDAYET